MHLRPLNTRAASAALSYPPMNELKHVPVLLDETIRYLDPKPGENFIDGTVGDGGHALKILTLTSPDGKIFGFDRDEQALRRARENLLIFGERVKLIHDNFSNINKYVQSMPDICGVLLDLGFSLAEIKDPQRGFSFSAQGPLDMRYDRRQELTAAQIVNTYSEQELSKIIGDYGGEKYADEIARGIIQYRKKTPIATTQELVRVIGESVPNRYLRSKIHFATRTFQALRIETNDELESLNKALPRALEFLKQGGRIVVISFHSLEDRIVKNFFRDNQREGRVKILTKKPIVPTEGETKDNPRARSAKLRAAKII